MLVMNKMKYNTNKHSNEKLLKQGQSSVIWAQNRVPPLVSISSLAKQQNKSKQTIKSLRHSDVVSVYAQEQISPERTNSQIYAYPFQYIKDQRYDGNNGKYEVQQVDKEETFIKRLTRTNGTNLQLFKNLNYQQEQEYIDNKSFKSHQKIFQLQNCKAIQLYNKIFSQKQHQNDVNNGSFKFQWMQDKTASQLLANLMTNSSRLKLYIHYLIKEIDTNERNKLLNQLYQQNVRQYNPTLKETYTYIICLISKLLNKKQPKQRNSNSNVRKNPALKIQHDMLIEVSLYENGINLNIDPKSSSIKISNNAKIRELRHMICEKEQKIDTMKKLYEGIIQNYAFSIDNIASQNKQSHIKEQQSSFANLLPAPLKESRVYLQVQEQSEQNKIRNKNPTFGMMKRN